MGSIKPSFNTLNSDKTERCATEQNLLIRLDVIFNSDIMARKKKCCSFNQLYVKVS